MSRSSFVTFCASQLLWFTAGSSSPTLLSGPSSWAGIVSASLSDAHPNLLKSDDDEDDDDENEEEEEEEGEDEDGDGEG